MRGFASFSSYLFELKCQASVEDIQEDEEEAGLAEVGMHGRVEVGAASMEDKVVVVVGAKGVEGAEGGEGEANQAEAAEE